MKRFFVSLVLLVLVLGFFMWRVDNPRLERFRLSVSDFMPDFGAWFKPITNVGNIAVRFQSYDQILRENNELRKRLREVDELRDWAKQLEQANAELRALNNLKYVGKLDYITGEVSADVGGNFAHTALLNVGQDKGVTEGAPVLDSFGLVGRVIAVGHEKSRILLLSDPQAQFSVTIMPDRIRAIVSGNGTANMDIRMIDAGKRLLAGSRVVTSGDGILPPELLIGQIVIDTASGQSSVRMSADFEALEFVRVLFDQPDPEISDEPPLVGADDAGTEEPVENAG